MEPSLKEIDERYNEYVDRWNTTSDSEFASFALEELRRLLDEIADLRLEIRSRAGERYG